MPVTEHLTCLKSTKTDLAKIGADMAVIWLLASEFNYDGQAE